ncbi:ABC transporter ATP-binding protein/permease [Staphylococcus ratti]|uniref:ABC transporter ATP-binding protein/permease n=1 Tax=Staphylococcus ratti TaxID=2892440 RepID=A0ABY3PBV1_9STAP|nr:ABC transporter ATP-binding protein/permease [Staphylococcus ratti]UEX89802.1 ABC transporter ATP-binding protein/permease [Staphylococcus ratti]
MKWLYSWLKDYRRFVIFLGIVNIGLALTIITQNVTIAMILNALLFKENNQWHVLLGLLAGSLVFRALFMMFNDWIGERLSYHIRCNVRQRLLKQRSSQSVGAQLTTATETLKEMLPFFRTYLPQLFKSMLVPFTIIMVMFWVHVPTALIMIVTAPFIPLFYIIFGLKTRDAAKDQMTFLNHFSQRFVNLTRGLVTLKLFQRSDDAIRKIEHESTQFRDKTMVILKSAFLSGLMLDFISMLGIGLVALEVGLSLIVFNNISFLTAVIALILAPEFYNAIKDLGQAFHVGKESEGASEIIRNALAETPVKDIDSVVVSHQQPLIQFNQVTYQYPNATVDALHNVSAHIFEREHIAVVGPSGAGKTTLIRLLLGEHRPTKGTITFSKTLNIGYLSQTPYIFNATIAENVTLFKDIDDNDVIEVLEQVALGEKIEQLKEGIHTLIGEGGEMLSGGEMRRIELARVLLLKPQLIVLDEPTAGLDHVTENKIHETLQAHFAHITRITIAHRRASISSATRRWYIKNGRLIRDDRTIETEF